MESAEEEEELPPVRRSLRNTIDHDYSIRQLRNPANANRNSRSRRLRLLEQNQQQNTDHDYDIRDVEEEEASSTEQADTDTAGEENVRDVEENAVENGDANAENVSGNAQVVVQETASSSSVQEVVNLTTPSPAKKRKRLSLGNTPKSNTPKISGMPDDADDEEGLTCPICMEPWEMSGPHRLISLRCGHLFGEYCIRRWLNEMAGQHAIRSCPQCKTKAALKDIRHLYAKRLRAIDRSEEHRLRLELSEEHRKTISLQTDLSTLKMSYTMMSNKIQTLEAENERMRNMLSNGGRAGFGATFEAADSKHLLYNYKLFMERNIEISREPGCRVMQYSPQQESLIVSQKSTQGLFPGYGLRFINTPSFTPLNFLHTSAKILRDISLNSEGCLLAVASMEPRVKLFDLRTKQVTSVYTPCERPLWAVAMDRNEREHFLYMGAQHGCTYVYDVRFPETVVDEFKTEGDLSPVINVAPVAANKHFPNGGFLVCKLQSLWFHEYTITSGSVTSTRLNFEGPFVSMSFDLGTESLLISTRPSTKYPQSRYVIGQLESIDSLPILNVQACFFGSKISPVMSRISQIAVESNTLIAAYLQDTKLLTLFDVGRQQRLQSMPVQDLVYDTCPVYLSNATYLAALTETKCRIYKLTKS